MKLIVTWQREIEVDEREYVTLKDGIYMAAWDAHERMIRDMKFQVETPGGMRWEVDLEEEYAVPRRIA